MRFIRYERDSLNSVSYDVYKIVKRGTRKNKVNLISFTITSRINDVLLLPNGYDFDVGSTDVQTPFYVK